MHESELQFCSHHSSTLPVLTSVSVIQFFLECLSGYLGTRYTLTLCCGHGLCDTPFHRDYISFPLDYNSCSVITAHFSGICVASVITACNDFFILITLHLYHLLAQNVNTLCGQWVFYMPCDYAYYSFLSSIFLHAFTLGKFV